MDASSNSYSFDSDFLNPSSKQDVYLVVLNYKLPQDTATLWRKAKYRICADGGANRLYDELPSMVPHMDPASARASHLPDLIKGDLDSVRPDVRAFYTSHGVPVVDLSADQDTTDLTKCTIYTESLLQQQAGASSEGHRQASYAIIALGALGGRLDHTLSNINTLHMFPHLNMVLMGDGNLARVLPPGRSIIRPDRGREGPTCGLVPMAGTAVANSTGLRWNLEATEMKFSGLVSTSNLIDGDVVTVESDVPLLWTTELSQC